MALIEIDEPSPSTLRWFGVSLAGLLAIVGAIVWARAGAPMVAYGIWAAAALLLVIYYAVPRVRRAVFWAWMVATYPLGFVISHLAMAVTYYLVLTPIGLLLRASGRDPMQRKRDDGAESYWVRRGERGPVSSYFRRF